VTEADWRLFTTLVRFDSVYVGHFKCNLRRLIDYPNLWDYARELFQYPGVAATVDFTHIKRHYYQSHKSINPTGVVPVGPELDFLLPHTPASFCSLSTRNRRAGHLFNHDPPEERMSAPTAKEIIELSKDRGYLAKQLYAIFTTPANGIAPVLENLQRHLDYQELLKRRGVMFAAGAPLER
jgi:hypothetical protein